jgi:hypothetical protein
MVATLALASAGLIVRPRAWTAAGTLAPAHLALLALLDDPRDASAIGRAYVHTLSAAERSAEKLVRAIFADASLDMRTPPGFGIVGSTVNERMRRDFSEGAIVTVDGWILSLTEARLYALAALAPGTIV